MKRSYLIAALLSTLAMGFFAGRVSSSEKPDDTGKDEAGDPQSKLRTRVADRPNPSITNSSSSRLRQDIRKAAPEKLAAMMAPVMETVDPILRRQLLYDLFERMDAGNFRELTEAMDRAALETGRDNHIEWLLVHTRAGQVAGAEAMKQWDPENGVKITDPGWRTMWGWASNDPDAALQWLNQKESLNPADRAKLLNAIASGAIMRDPAKAADLLSTFSEAEKLQCVGQFTFEIRLRVRCVLLHRRPERRQGKCDLMAAIGEEQRTRFRIRQAGHRERFRQGDVPKHQPRQPRHNDCRFGAAVRRHAGE